ncbi:cephalosporin esterase [Cytidiella melzeri]|nr:cephalosporin esterase [Cytidiella melzeri]
MLQKTCVALLCIIFCTCVQASFRPPPPATPIVDLGYATYQGSYNKTTDTTNFLGVRYAASPVGKLRFQAPAPPSNERSLGIQMADTLSTGCVQSINGVNQTTPFRSGNGDHLPQRRQSTPDPEDCLFLNVFVSGQLTPNAKMPVLVWIHGGGYVALSTSGQSGDDLIAEAGGGIVAVTFDYRLGVFGFLPGSQVKQKGALNAGLLDQEAVLKWVQQNIHLFGGDPTQVTIWGESAGGGSVVQHMVAHGGNTQPPLFKGAISSSLFFPSQYNFNDTIPEQLYAEFVHATGCSNATDTFDCLVDVDVATLGNVNLEINESGFFGVFVVVPVVDGEFIQTSPTAQIIKGPLNGERLLTVTNTFEGTIFVNPNFTAQMTVADYVTQLFPHFSQAQINAAAAQYTNVTSLKTVTDKAIAIYGESILICPTYLLLQSFHGPAYKAEFAIAPGTHFSDTQYYFPSGGLPPIPIASPPAPKFTNVQFDASFAGAFTAFAKFGDVNRHPVPQVITPQWDMFRGRNTEMLFNRTEDYKPDIRAFSTDPGLLERCAFWKSVAGPAGH